MQIPETVREWKSPTKIYLYFDGEKNYTKIYKSHGNGGSFLI